jgi:hypothetical protein
VDAAQFLAIPFQHGNRFEAAFEVGYSDVPRPVADENAERLDLVRSRSGATSSASATTGTCSTRSPPWPSWRGSPSREWSSAVPVTSRLRTRLVKLASSRSGLKSPTAVVSRCSVSLVATMRSIQSVPSVSRDGGSYD